jgi:hypothetical protein
MANESEQKDRWHLISVYLLPRGVLFLTFAAISFAMKPSEAKLWGLTIPIMPNEFYTALGIIAIIVSVSFMVAAMVAASSESRSEKIRKLLDGPKKDTPFWQISIQTGIQNLYYVIFYLVFVIGWLKALVLIPTDNASAFLAVFWVGFLWLIVISLYLIFNSIRAQIFCFRALMNERRKSHAQKPEVS